MFSTVDLDHLLTQDAALRAVQGEVRARMRTDGAHDEGHLRRVAVWAVRFAPPGDARAAVAAALLHDVVNLPKDHPERAQASVRSADVARALLPGLGFTADEVERVAGAVRDHSFSRGATPDTPLGDALQDADRLEALGALGVLRCAATGGRLDRALLHDLDPWGEARALDDGEYTLDHFFVKLLRLPATFRTPGGRAEAARRAGTIHAFLTALGEELGVPYPAGKEVRESRKGTLQP
ncbi:HD domain-containing protein [Deinococcus maricopensis]|uniref:Metal dependent phosphohydrolase n=1 Tax=Deinococcus maricopensis (strain DSM 21211 / LMG 22137 / NRRL B-23946 / LB-34) TaxID=709986 RepID=E8U5V6_DEIML|nr:HD domain-containing protein [Deinococcus maricopensis]ADV66445.1 metal dependent phosphohydrolase [Deinococcus maricopensis DSM 21211]